MNVDLRNIEPLTRSSGLGRTGSLTQGPPDRQQATGVNVPSVCAPDSFSIDFCNIRGLRSNFSSVEHLLLSSSPDILLLSETQLYANTSSDLFKINNYNLFPRFRKKRGVCAYCASNIPVTRLVDLESPSYDVIWLKVILNTKCIFICFLYFSPNLNPSQPFFNYLTRCHESLITSNLPPKSYLLGTSMFIMLSGWAPRELLLVGCRRMTFRCFAVSSSWFNTLPVSLIAMINNLIS